MSQIYHNIWIGGYEEAHDIQWLKKNGVTHILICAQEDTPKFSKKFQYKHLQLMTTDNFDLQPFLDSAADFILKACEEGILYIYGYKDESRGPACLTSFLMKFFGWDYLTCLKTISKKRSIIKLTKKHKLAVFQYWEELTRIKVLVETGQTTNSEIVSNFSSSMKPFFLRAKDAAKKRGAIHAYAYADDQNPFGDANQNEEIIGGENCTPRGLNEKKMNWGNNSRSMTNFRYNSNRYKGTDEFVRAKLEGVSQGIPQISKANSLVRLRRNQSQEDIINSCGYPGHPNQKGKRLANQDEEPPLPPQKDIESDFNSVASSTKALSFQSKRNRERREIKNTIEHALNGMKPRWMSKSIQDSNALYQVAHMRGPEARFYRKNCRKDPVIFETGLDKMWPQDMYNVPGIKDKYHYFSDKPVGRKFFTYVNNFEFNRMPRLDSDHEKKLKYTNTCCMVKGKSAFQTGSENFQPSFGKTSTIFNYKRKNSYLDQNGNSNVDWGNIAMGNLKGSGEVQCCYCHHKLVDQKDVVPHTYKKPVIDIRGNLSFVETYEDPDSGKKNRKCDSFSKDYKHVEDFYSCTGVFTKMMPFMRFDTSSNGGQILCPGCHKHVGQAKLSGIKCGCGFFSVPGFQLWKSRIVVKAK